MHSSPYDLATRLKYRRIWCGLHQAELAEKAGLSQRQISLYESGKSSPRKSTLEALCSALDTDPSWLMHGDWSSDADILSWLSEQQDKGAREVPLVTWSQAEHKHIGPHDSFVYAPSWIGVRSFALSVHGLGMAPDYPPGSIIVVDPDIEIQDGDDVVIYLNKSEEEPIFRRVSKEPGGLTALVATNGQYPALVADEGAQAVGVVVMQIHYRLNRRVDSKKGLKTSESDPVDD